MAQHQQLTFKRSMFCIALLLFAQFHCFQIVLGAETATSERTMNALSPGAREAAELLRISSKVNRLIELRQMRPTGSKFGDEEFSLQLDLIDKIIGGTLEVRMVADRIDRDLGWAEVGRAELDAKKQSYLNDLFALNFTQGGVLGINAGCRFLDHQPEQAVKLLLIGSGVGLTLATTTALLQHVNLYKKVDGNVTVLADILKLQQEVQPQHKPDIVFQYLNSVPPDGATSNTRLKTLIDMWEKEHYLRLSNEKQLNKIAALTPGGTKYHESSKLLSKRIRMLYDTKHTVEQLDGQLLELLRAVQ